MISVILYGRHDQHGYQYHKRLAISLNCIAEILHDPNDEILFVDYNTPDDLPTLLESIQDTLTDKTKALTKIFRIRPNMHRLYGKNAARKVLESLARNIAIRRSNPLNPWIMSTNSDMIFIPKNSKNLSQIAADLTPGFYTLPRFELPEYFWDTQLDRLQPQKNMQKIRENAEDLHLHMIVHEKPDIGYENVGDFQLMRREDIFAIGGFNENMQRGWHIDANLSKRMYLLHHKIVNLSAELAGYHCNHIRGTDNDMHGKFHVENNWKTFVSDVACPVVALDREWGLPALNTEEIKLAQDNGDYCTILKDILKKFPHKTYEKTLQHEFFNAQTYETAHVLVYLFDHFASLSKDTRIGYFGYNEVLRENLREFLQLRHSGEGGNDNDFDIYIFDFGFDTTDTRDKSIRNKLQKKIMKKFIDITRTQKKHGKQNKLIGIHTAYTDFKYLFKMKVRMSEPGYNSNICYGVTELHHTYLWQNIKLRLQYFVVRYCFDFKDQILRIVLRNKWSKLLVKN